MLFEELYGTALDFELGTEDRTERFTVVRRKAAINKAQLEFVRLTDVLTARYQLDLSTNIAEYDLDSLINGEAFYRLSEEQPFLERVDAEGDTITTEGQEFPRIDPEQLDIEQPGWHSQPIGIPTSWYQRELNNTTLFGLTPTPDIPTGHQWRVQIPYSSLPFTMTADADIPLRSRAGGAAGRKSLEPYHQALVHKAAYYLEKLRKNREGMIEQEQLFLRYVSDWREGRRPKGPDRVVMGHSYFKHAQTRMKEPDPYRE